MKSFVFGYYHRQMQYNNGNTTQGRITSKWLRLMAIGLLNLTKSSKASRRNVRFVVSILLSEICLWHTYGSLLFVIAWINCKLLGIIDSSLANLRTDVVSPGWCWRFVTPPFFAIITSSELSRCSHQFFILHQKLICCSKLL